MKIILDPTPADHTSLDVDGKTHEFPHSLRDSGASLIKKLSELEISESDELCVVLGPGNFTATRSACLIGNTVHFLTKCQLFAREKDAPEFSPTDSLEPIYASEPSITSPKK